MPSGFKKTCFFFFFFLFIVLKVAAFGEVAFTFNGFHGANLSLDGISSIQSNGLLELTNSKLNMKGHAFHPSPFSFKSSTGKVLSFSTTFVFGIISNQSELNGHGLAFLISRTNNLSTALASQYLGILNQNNNGHLTNHILAIELDTIQDPAFNDIDDNHLGIDIDNMTSYNSSTAGYHDTTGQFQNLSLKTGQPMQVWIDFDGDDMQLNVTLAPVQMTKPDQPLLSSTVDLSSLILDSMYIGFSSATGNAVTNHYVLGWSFKMNGIVESLDYTKLPKLPLQPNANSKGISKKLAIWLPLASFFLVVLVVVATVFVVRRRRLKYADLLDDWELEYGPHRFSYKDLYQATKGFKDSTLLGIGGFGRVYRGLLRTSNIEIAVKRVISHESGQGMKEFVAEILSIGQLRHRNIVQLLGYCRRKSELLLVYDFMPNGSLDKFLFDPVRPTLDWNKRFQIIKGVASGLLYLHEGWEQVVIHRDIKSSNVLLDSEMNGKLGDFGLAKLYDHGANPQTTHVVGTMGYIAPEVVSTGKATTSSDVFAFGVFLLEMACGRSALASGAPREQEILVDWVLDNWKRGLLIATSDARLGEDYSMSEMEMVLKLGLSCSHPIAAARPNMRQVMQFLDGDTVLPELSLPHSSLSNLSSNDNVVTLSSSSVITMPDFSEGQ